MLVDITCFVKCNREKALHFATASYNWAQDLAGRRICMKVNLHEIITIVDQSKFTDSVPKHIASDIYVKFIFSLLIIGMKVLPNLLE